ncbi:MAG TPA: phosphatidylserine/phosphatidylglycerophosphate/cardiolipin synthase family protein [Rhizomicrobium sp.]|jgi:phosphatidylserine/phosphatidylglycerophosphate/cardiolipin synthase-like enzyme|nr:phosphatidylserine/phosphatidylglycerophosphate/cardiolipin synthase family protein [Rhizomicrobium sp.]
MTIEVPSHIPAVSTGSYPVRAGNLLRPLIDGEAAFGRICEAVEGARKSVWLTVAFHKPDFAMPGGRGSLFDVLDKAKARGVDVRVIFWRTETAPGEHFFGTQEDRAWLGARGSKFLARWDRAQKDYCQHQKSWLVDAGEAGETAFVGGINLVPSSVCAAGHADRDGRHTHDVYLELRGPSATDVHHNFVQRWNEASERHRDDGAWPDAGDSLPFPATASPQAGDAIVQMQRTVRAGHYSDETATPGGTALPIAKGEFSIFDQYVKAIDAARSTIYIEDQYILSPDIVERLHAALARGVEVVFLCPATPEEQVVAGMRHARAAPLRERLGALGNHPNFLLAGIASPRTGEAVYIHDKIMLVDDCWATIGSCNIASRSFFGDTELNAAIWDEDAVRALRVELLNEHLGVDTSRMESRDALKLFAEAARGNAQARFRGEKMKGLAFALDPAMYGI